MLLSVLLLGCSEGQTVDPGGLADSGTDASINDGGAADVTIVDGGHDAPAEGSPDGSGEAAPPVAYCPSTPDEPNAYAILAVCRRCHQEPPLYGAPFPLLTLDDMHFRSGSGLMRYERMYGAVATGYMPYLESEIEPPVEPYSEGEKRTLLLWLEQGAQAVGGRACEQDAED